MLRPPLNLDLGEESEELFKKAVEVVVQYERSSPSLLQRRLSIGYARAARLIDQLEGAGVIGPADGAKPREVLINSADELLSNLEESPKNEQNDGLNFPANYKAPVNLTLSKVENVPWGKQLSEVLNSNEYKKLKTEFPILLGYDNDKLQVESLLDIGNLIIAGNIHSQKENFLDTILLTYLLRYSPWDLRFVLTDVTQYLDLYEGVPHLLDSIVTDHSKAISVFRWSLHETRRRMKQFSEAGVRDIASYNKLAGIEAQSRILFITRITYFDNETTDLISEVLERGMQTGIHNIFVVSKTDNDSLPRSIKSHISVRVIFKLTSAGDSRGIDVSGAEKLEPGEIIYEPNYGSSVKLNAVFTPVAAVKEVVKVVKQD